VTKRRRKPLVRVGRRRAASILGMRQRELEELIAANRIRTERVRSRDYITIRELARFVATETPPRFELKPESNGA